LQRYEKKKKQVRFRTCFLLILSFRIAPSSNGKGFVKGGKLTAIPYKAFDLQKSNPNFLFLKSPI
jgi:hypothetical protein